MITRFAPTPSGYLHLGNIFCFACTSALSRKLKGDILLRIDDMDNERADERYVADIFETLGFLGITWQIGPKDLNEFKFRFSQRLRLPLYEHALRQLKDKGLIFACKCSRAEVLANSTDGGYPGTCRHRNLDLDEPGVNWRMKTDTALPVQIQSPQGISSHYIPPDMRDFVVRKKDGFPAYQLCSVIDDIHFGVNLIVRGEDLLHSSIAQLYLAAQLGLNQFTQSLFVHHPLLTDKQGRKLSKSAGDTSIQFLRNAGARPEDVFSLIAMQSGYDQHISNWNEMLDWIDKNFLYTVKSGHCDV